jgi:hypothetical protein
MSSSSPVSQPNPPPKKRGFFEKAGSAITGAVSGLFAGAFKGLVGAVTAVSAIAVAGIAGLFLFAAGQNSIPPSFGSGSSWSKSGSSRSNEKNPQDDEKPKGQLPDESSPTEKQDEKSPSFYNLLAATGIAAVVILGLILGGGLAVGVGLLIGGGITMGACGAIGSVRCAVAGWKDGLKGVASACAHDTFGLDYSDYKEGLGTNFQRLKSEVLGLFGKKPAIDPQKQDDKEDSKLDLSQFRRLNDFQRKLDVQDEKKKVNNHALESVDRWRLSRSSSASNLNVHGANLAGHRGSVVMEDPAGHLVHRLMQELKFSASNPVCQIPCSLNKKIELTVSKVNENKLILTGRHETKDFKIEAEKNKVTSNDCNQSCYTAMLSTFSKTGSTIVINFPQAADKIDAMIESLKKFRAQSDRKVEIVVPAKLVAEWERKVQDKVDDLVITTPEKRLKNQQQKEEKAGKVLSGHGPRSP